MKFVDLSKQYQTYKEEIDSSIKQTIDSSQFILGESVCQLEKELAAYCGTNHAVGVASGTDALILSLLAHDIKPDDEVITTPFTFIATVETIAFLGAKPVFTEIDPVTYNMDPNCLKETIQTRKKAGAKLVGIIPVSLYGMCPDMEAINKIAKENGLFVIEDACQSFGTIYKGQRSCGLTSLSVTSFFPSKPLGCYGDGGMVFAKDENLAQRLRSLRNHGQRKRYYHEEIGINSRLDAIQASILLAKFRHFEDEIKKREDAARRYNKLLEDIVPHVTLPFVPEDRTSVYAQYTIRIADGKRDTVANFLNNEGIPTAIHYPLPIHLQPCFKYLEYREGEFPIAEKASKEVLSLPMHPFITIKEQEIVADTIKKSLSRGEF